MQNLQTELISLLAEDDRFVAEGKLLKNTVISSAINLDSSLLKLLLSNKNIKEHFFQNIDGVYVFDKSKFQKFVNNKSFLADSYTSFKNKIGLLAGDEYLIESSEVVLAWPHKDCVLEGGQTKEEEKREEIFWNETLAPDEIDCLLAEKVFTNFKKYDNRGCKSIDEITKKDNLYIKGNNLLVLHSLKKIFHRSIKCIYLDLPYNTGNDSFGYNDNFNHSSWLTFMKNRLEVAFEMLTNDGVIFLQIDERELAYLKILCDELFKRDNFVIQINWQRTTQRSVLGQGATAIINIMEYILCYVKDVSYKDKALKKTQKFIEANDKMYNQYNLQMIDEGERKLFKTINENGQDEIRIYKHEGFQINSIKKENRNESYYIKNFDTVVRKDSQQQESSLEQLILSNIQKNSCLFSVERILRQGKRKGEMKKTFYMNDNVIYHLKDYSEVIDGKINRKVDMNNIWLESEISSAGIAEEGGVKLKRGKKPEALIERIINIANVSQEDIVMDFFAGSGTTCAVAHKMGIQYIGIEQLDYYENDTVTRLKNVIGGDGTGISDKYSWKGGGSFIYCELLELNQKYVEQINTANTRSELKVVWKIIQEEAFISYKIKVEQINKNISEFDSLSLEEQKKFLIEILDKNLLYLNYSEIDDQDYKITADDKKINKTFYSIK